MSGIDDARAAAEGIKNEIAAEETQESEQVSAAKEEVKTIIAERSGALAQVTKTMAVAGLEDVPMSIIPVPFYKLVQPGSTNTTKSDGVEATPGNFLMGDNGEETEKLSFLLLRAKRQTRTFTGDDGQPTQSVTMAVLGLNLTRMTPFILSVPVSSFYNFGQLMAAYKERAVAHAWDYPVVATTEKQEQEKDTARGRQKVKYWTISFNLEKEPVTPEVMQKAQTAYEEYAASLDRNQTTTEDTRAESEEGSDIPF